MCLSDSSDFIMIGNYLLIPVCCLRKAALGERRKKRRRSVRSVHFIALVVWFLSSAARIDGFIATET